MKITFVIVGMLGLILTLPAPGAAQTFFGVSGGIADPAGSFRNDAGIGAGGSISYQEFVSNSIALHGSVGYWTWSNRHASSAGIDFNAVSVPVTMGISSLLARGVVAPYFGISAGLHFLRKQKTFSDPLLASQNVDENETWFGLTPNVGIAVHVFGPVAFNVNASYVVMYTSGSPTKYFSGTAGAVIGF